MASSRVTFRSNHVLQLGKRDSGGWASLKRWLGAARDRIAAQKLSFELPRGFMKRTISSADWATLADATSPADLQSRVAQIFAGGEKWVTQELTTDLFAAVDDALLATTASGVSIALSPEVWAKVLLAREEEPPTDPTKDYFDASPSPSSMPTAGMLLSLGVKRGSTLIFATAEEAFAAVKANLLLAYELPAPWRTDRQLLLDIVAHEPRILKQLPTYLDVLPDQNDPEVVRAKLNHVPKSWRGLPEVLQTKANAIVATRADAAALALLSPGLRSDAEVVASARAAGASPEFIAGCAASPTDSPDEWAQRVGLAPELMPLVPESLRNDGMFVRRVLKQRPEHEYAILSEMGPELRRDMAFAKELRTDARGVDSYFETSLDIVRARVGEAPDAVRTLGSLSRDQLIALAQANPAVLGYAPAELAADPELWLACAQTKEVRDYLAAHPLGSRKRDEEFPDWRGIGDLNPQWAGVFLQELAAVKASDPARYERLCAGVRDAKITGLGAFWSVAELEAVLHDRNAENDPRPVAVMTVARRSDLAMSAISRRALEPLLTHYRVVYEEVASDAELVRAVQRATSKKKSPLIMFMGHGLPDSIEFDRGGDGKEAGRLDLTDRAKLLAIRDALTPGGVVIHNACSNAEGGDLGQDLVNQSASVFTQGAVLGAIQSFGGISADFTIDPATGRVLEVSAPDDLTLRSWDQGNAPKFSHWAPAPESPWRPRFTIRVADENGSEHR